MIAVILGFVTGLLNLILEIVKKAVLGVLLFVFVIIALFAGFSIFIIHMLT